MRIGDVLYFSPKVRFSELNFDDPRSLADAFLDRVEGFYLQPSARSLAAGDAFAAGLVCCAAIEFFATVSSDKRPSVWLRANIAEFRTNDKLASRFWKHFRDGLAHEGRIKSFGQFSLDLPTMLTPIGSALIVNPRLLLQAVQAAFHRYCEQMDDRQAAFLTTRLRRYFDAEVKNAKE